MKFKNVSSGRLMDAAKSPKLDAEKNPTDAVIVNNAATYAHSSRRVKISVSEAVADRIDELAPTKAEQSPSEDNKPTDPTPGAPQGKDKGAK